MKKILILVALLFCAGLLSFWIWQQNHKNDFEQKSNQPESTINEKMTVFATGCFWCSELYFERTKGVTKVISGYSDDGQIGSTDDGKVPDITDHREAIQVFYNPDIVSYADLLEVFFRYVDASDSEGQFSDRGRQYAPAVFFQNEKQKVLAEGAIQELDARNILPGKVVVEVLPFKKFYPAEERHQDYYKKNSLRCASFGSDRGNFFRKTWKNELKKAQKLKLEDKSRLTPRTN